MADETLTLTLDSGGDVVIKLRPDLAPGHVERITALAKEGFYDDVVFHRVIPGFMAQGGDPTGTGMGGSQLPDIKAEFNAEPHVRGVCSMARAMNPSPATNWCRNFSLVHVSLPVETPPLTERETDPSPNSSCPRYSAPSPAILLVSIPPVILRETVPGPATN